MPANDYCWMCHFPPVFCKMYLRVLRWFLRRFIAQLLSHRPNASAPHRVAARTAGDLQTSLELHLQVGQPTRCTRTEDVEPQQRVLGEAWMRTHVKGMVERLWLDDPANVKSGAPSNGKQRVDALLSTA
jgi:hypothetical protein